MSFPSYVKSNYLELPNVLSLLRIVSIPILTFMIKNGNQMWNLYASLLFFLVGLTDFVDGWIARRMKKVSTLGTYLDPLADKLLVTSLLIVLVGENRIPVWIAIIISCREFTVMGMRTLAVAKGHSLPSSPWGKSKTFFQIVSLFFLIMYYPLGSFDPYFFGIIFLWGSVFISIFSGLFYFISLQKKINTGV